MARKNSYVRKVPSVDPKYGDDLMGRFINILMLSGNKSLAQNILYKALDQVQEKVPGDLVENFRKAIDNARPLLVIKSTRVGGAALSVPIEVKEEKGINQAMRWIRDCAKVRKEKGMIARLAAELGDAFNSIGGAVKKKEDAYKMAMANMAFAYLARRRK